MRLGVWLLLLARVASADDGSLHVRMLHEQPDDGPLLHLDGVLIDPAMGNPSETHGVQLAIGPRARFAAQGTSWQAGLSPDDAIDAHDHGFRGAAELSYDLGWFSLGANVSLTSDITGTHRTAGLFAFRKFRLSRWMHAWIALGLSFDSYDSPNAPPRSGTTLGLSLGTTFR